MTFQVTLTTKEAEAYGLLKAFNWIQEEVFFNITIELDNKPVINGILDITFHHNEFSSTLANSLRQKVLKIAHLPIKLYLKKQGTPLVALALVKVKTRNTFSSAKFESIT